MSGEDADCHWLRALADYLAAAPHVQLAFLFGSQARGTARADSDVDVAVYLRAPYAAEDVRALWNGIEDLVRRDVDLIVLNEAAPGTAWTAFQGRVLVKKDNGLFIQKMLEFSREAEDLRQTILELADLRRKRRGI